MIPLPATWFPCHRRVRTRACRLGFTLIELLVVIAIIGVLVAILMPAIQQARSAARRTVCLSNLKQIGIAILSYHESTHAFPLTMTDGGGPAPGSSGAANGSGCRTGFFSWRAQILPYLEQQALYDQINFNVGMGDLCKVQPVLGLGGRIHDDNPNATAARTVVAAFLCPDDGYQPTSQITGTAVPASDNYVANMGWPSNSVGVAGERPLVLDPITNKKYGAYNGVISVANPNPTSSISWHPRRAISIKDVTDGLQYTALVSERLVQRVEDKVTLTTRMNTFEPKRFFACSDGDDRLRTQQQLIDVAKGHVNVDASIAFFVPYVGHAWISGWVLASPTYMHVWPPNTGNSTLHGGENDGNMLFSPSSNHPGGVHLLFADGTARWIGDGISAPLWWSLGSRDGQEMIDSPSF